MGAGHWQDHNGAAQAASWVPFQGYTMLPTGLLFPEQERNAAAVRVRFRRKLNMYANSLIQNRGSK